MSCQKSTFFNENLECHKNLHDAVKKNDIVEIERLLSLGADTNALDCEGKTPLQKLVLENKENIYLDAITLLLNYGADVNAPDSRGNTVLHNLAEEKTKFPNAILDLLFKFKAKVDAKNDQGETPLFRAVHYEIVEMSQFLADRGANVNVHNNIEEATPLHWACLKGNEEIIKILVDYGANVNAHDSSGRIPLMDYFDNLQNKRWFSLGNRTEIKMLRVLLDCSDLSVNSTSGIRKGYNNFIHGTSYYFVLKIMLEQIAKLQELGIPIHSSLLEAIPKNPDYQIYYQQCTKELIKAKDTKLHNSWVSFLNLLVDNERKLKNYAGNQDLVEDFEKGSWVLEFPIYGPLIKDNMKKGIEIRKLYDKSASTLSYYCPIFNPSHLVIRDSLDCLNFEDYKIFA